MGLIMIPIKTNKEIVRDEIPQLIYLISGYLASFMFPITWFIVAILVSFIIAVGMKVAMRDNIKSKVDFDLYLAKMKNQVAEKEKEKQEKKE